MADILIEREHGLSLEQARNIAHTWADQAQETFFVGCNYTEGEIAKNLDALLAT